MHLESQSVLLLSGFTIDEMGESSWLGDTLTKRTCFDWMRVLKKNRTRLNSHILVYSIKVSSNVMGSVAQLSTHDTNKNYVLTDSRPGDE